MLTGLGRLRLVTRAACASSSLGPRVRRGSLIQLGLLGLVAAAITTAVALFVPWLPVAAGKVAFASAATAAANKGLDLLLVPEEQIPGVHILRMDVFSLLSAVKVDPTHFGFIDIKDPCLTTTSICSDPDHTFFWDTFHPTLFGHAFFAVTLENVLTQQDE